MTRTVTLCPITINEDKGTLQVIEAYNKAVRTYLPRINKPGLPSQASKFTQGMIGFQESVGQQWGYKISTIPITEVTLSEEAWDMYQAFVAFSAKVQFSFAHDKSELQSTSNAVQLVLFLMRKLVLHSLQEGDNFSATQTALTEPQFAKSTPLESGSVEASVGESIQRVNTTIPLVRLTSERYPVDSTRKKIAESLGVFVESVLKNQNIFTSSARTGDQFRSANTFPKLHNALVYMATQIENKQKNSELLKRLTNNLSAIEETLRLQIIIIALPEVDESDFSDSLSDALFFKILSKKFPALESTSEALDSQGVPLSAFYSQCEKLESAIQASSLSNDPTVYNSKPVLLGRIKELKKSHALGALAGKMGVMAPILSRSIGVSTPKNF